MPSENSSTTPSSSTAPTESQSKSKLNIPAIAISLLIVIAAICLSCDNESNKKVNPSKDLSSKILTGWTKNLGEKHPLIAKAKFRLSLDKKNDYKETLETLLSVVQDEQTTIEKDEYADPSDLIATMHSFGTVLVSIGEKLEGELRKLTLSTGLKVLLDLLEIQGLAIGLGHELCYELRNIIAGVHELLGEYDQAIVMWLYVVEFKGRTLGTDHKETYEARRRIGIAMTSQGSLDRAHMELAQTFDGLEENYGEDHLLTLRIQRDIARVLKAKGNTAKAREMLEKLVRKQTEVLGEDHEETKLTRESILNFDKL